MSVTALYIPYKVEFEPIVRSEENIAIPVSRDKMKYFRVLYVEPVQPIEVIVSLNADETDKEKELNEIELEDNYAGQWRIASLDLAYAEMYYPRAVPKYVTKNVETYIRPMSMNAPNILEFYTWKDEVPILKVTNPISEAQVARFAIWGFKYAIEELKEAPKEYTIFPIYSAEYVIGGRGR